MGYIQFNKRESHENRNLALFSNMKENVKNGIYEYT